MKKAFGKFLILTLIFGFFASAFVPVSALAAGTGTLVITTQDTSKKQVAAQISVDNELRGTGTATLKKLPAKTYEVKFGDLAGYTIVSPRSGKKNVTVKAGKTTPVTATYKKSSSGGGGAKTYVTPSFTDNGNGTVTDSANNLMWQQGENDPNGYNWWYVASGTYDATYNPSSTSVCGSLSLAGYSGWRLPTFDELKTLIDTSRSTYPYINTTFFPNAYSSAYWSSTTYAYGTTLAWYVYFDDGGVYGYGKSNNNYARCVRGGQ